MMRLSRILVLLMLCIFPRLLSAEDDAAVRLALEPADPAECSWSPFPLSESPPTGCGVPDGLKGAWFGRQDFGPDRKLTVAALLAPEATWILVDRDFDNDLSDEKAMRFSGSPDRRVARIEVEIAVDPENPPQRVTICFAHQPSYSEQHLLLMVPLHLTGEVTLGGRVRRVRLHDGDHDLGFASPDRDRLYLDVDGDLEIETGRNSNEEIRPGSPFRLGKAGYVVRVAGRRELVFGPSEQTPGPSEMRWPHLAPPKAGRTLPAGAGSFVELALKYPEAEQLDGATGRDVITNRTPVIDDVGKTGAEDAFWFLLDLAAHDPSIEIRRLALRATAYECYQPFSAEVCRLGGSRASEKIRSAVLYALHGMDAPDRQTLLQSLLTETRRESVFSEAARYLAFEGSETAFALLDKYAIELENERFRYLAYLSAARYRRTPPPAALVISAAKSFYKPLMCLGLRHAGMLDLPQCVALGAAALGSINAEVRLAAVRLLATRDDPDAVVALLPSADRLSDRERAEITRLMSAVRRPEIIELFRQRLSSGSPADRALAITMMSGIEIDPILKALLGRLKKERKVRVLVDLIRAVGMRRLRDTGVVMLNAVKRVRKDPETFETALAALATYGMDAAGVRRFFEDALRSRDIQRRLTALDALAEAGGPVCAELMTGCVDDEAWQVRLTAVEGLGNIRWRGAVLPLIDQLEKESAVRVIAAITNALFRTTGCSFYDLVDLWRKWWTEHGATFVVPEVLPEARPDEDRGRTVAKFYGIPVETNRLILVMDRSGSMLRRALEAFDEPPYLRRGDRTCFEVAVEQALQVFKALDGNALINVILFDSSIHPWQRGLVRLTPEKRKALKTHLEATKPEGGTNLFDGLEMALLTPDVDTIYLLSDGNPREGKFRHNGEILHAVRQINRFRKITIHCVAVGYESLLLSEMAKQNGGQYVWRH